MMPARFSEIAAKYAALRITVVGDFCLDRYLEIDPSRAEVSLETGLPVHNVVNVRAQPGGAGTIVSNLAALGVGTILPVGVVGDDGEGYELSSALKGLAGVRLNHLVHTKHRRTFTYCKPLVIEPGKAPIELNRLDLKNWTSTSAWLQGLLSDELRRAAASANAMIVLDQVDVPETGVVTQRLLVALKRLVEEQPDLLVLADSRRGLRGFPPVVFKMNSAELAALTGAASELSPDQVEGAAATLARNNGRAVFVTLAARGILGATPTGQVEYAPALPVRGEIDVVGAGDAVSANLAAALAAGATVGEALEIANVAASVVVHKLGTTGTASPAEIAALLGRA
jgi:rfaE bifunctional protein kinase chain/domain